MSKPGTRGTSERRDHDKRVTLWTALSGIALAGAVGCTSGASNPGPPAASGGETGGSGGTRGSGGTGGSSRSGGTGGLTGISGSGVPPIVDGHYAGTGGSVPRTCAEVPSDGAGGAAGNGSSSGPPCPGTAGPAMVRLPEGYCIDSTEVTRGQYTAWVTTQPSVDGQDTACDWNPTFAPDPACMAMRYVCDTGSADPHGCDDDPQPCVDWCDASAFCKAAGKRLCGKIGGGANPFGDPADARSSQWYAACSSGAANNAYSTGATLDCSCNGPDNAPSWEVALRRCHSPVDGYSGVSDLSGNLWEWEDSCDGSTGISDSCHKRGGSFGGGLGPQRAGSERCDDPTTVARNTVEVNLGFRCCAD